MTDTALSPRFIRTPEGVASVVDALGAHPGAAVGLDTEFHAERRYRPELMLVQLHLPTVGTWILDPRAVDLHPLGPTLSSRPWIAPGASTDIRLMKTATGAAPT